MIEVRLNRNGKYWQARWTDYIGWRQAKSLGAAKKISKRDAARLAKLLEMELNGGSPAGVMQLNSNAPSLEDWLEKFTTRKSGLADSTAAMYARTIAVLLDSFGKATPIDKITPSTAADWRDAVADGSLGAWRNGDKPSESTVRRFVREARCIFNLAVTEKVIAENPFKGLAGMPVDIDKDWAVITHDDLKKIMGACPDRDWRLLFALCRLAGLRRGEALALKWEHVDLNNRRLTVKHTGKRTTKKRRRQVPVSPRLHDLLFAAYMDDNDSEYVCGRLWSSKTCGNLFRDANTIIEKAGLEAYAKPYHTLRKNLETEWMSEFPLPVVCEWLGNSPEVAMRHYIRAEQSHFDSVSGKPAEKLAQNRRKDKLTSQGEISKVSGLNYLHA